MPTLVMEKEKEEQKPIKNPRPDVPGFFDKVKERNKNGHHDN